MDKHLIMIRRGEIDRELERLQERIQTLTSERDELDIAQRVFDRLSGAKRGSAGAGNEPEPKEASSNRSTDRPTVREMIREALKDAQERGIPGLAPRQIRDYIRSKYEVDLGQQVNTTASRMWNQIGELNKDTQSGLFSLPGSTETDDGNAGEQSSSVSIFK